MQDERSKARAARASAAEKYKPDVVELLLVAQAPPGELERYFYFEDVSSDDWLFREVVLVLFGEKPDRSEKSKWLAEFRDLGVFLVDLKLDPVDGSDLGQYAPDLVSRCAALAPSKIVLIKVDVYDAALTALKRAGLPVVDARMPFPSSGQQKEFRRLFAAALGLEAPSEITAEPKTSKKLVSRRSKHRNRFSRDEATQIRSLIDRVRAAQDKSQAKKLRQQLRGMGFFINDYRTGNEGFTSSYFDWLVSRGTITIVDSLDE